MTTITEVDVFDYERDWYSAYGNCANCNEPDTLGNLVDQGYDVLCATCDSALKRIWEENKR